MNIYTSKAILYTQFNETVQNLIRENAKKQVNKILQQANRRIQNITNAKLASPAVKAVIAERGKKNYTYFTISRLDPKNDTDWELIKYEYGRALSFLSNPTSTATGARQYINYQAKQLNNIPFESANKIVDLATEPTIDEYGNINIFSYGEILNEYKNDVMKIDKQMNESKEDYAKRLEDSVRQAVNSTKTETQRFLDRFF